MGPVIPTLDTVFLRMRQRPADDVVNPLLELVAGGRKLIQTGVPGVRLALVTVPENLFDQIFLTGKIEIHCSFGNAGPPCDLLDGHLCFTALVKQRKAASRMRIYFCGSSPE